MQKKRNGKIPRGPSTPEILSGTPPKARRPNHERGMDPYKKALRGEPIDMRTDEGYQAVLGPEMVRSRTLCHRINSLEPYSDEIRPLLDELFEGRLPKSSLILTPVHIDRGKTIRIGRNVFINWNFNTVSTGGIDIEDDVRIAPNVSLVTANHDLNDREILRCAPIRIKKGAWIGEGAKIMPGVTVGTGAVVAAGAVVTKDVAPHVVVGGNPAKKIKEIRVEPSTSPHGE